MIQKEHPRKLGVGLRRGILLDWEAFVCVLWMGSLTNILHI